MTAFVASCLASCLAFYALGAAVMAYCHRHPATVRHLIAAAARRKR